MDYAPASLKRGREEDNEASQPAAAVAVPPPSTGALPQPTNGASQSAGVEAAALDGSQPNGAAAGVQPPQTGAGSADLKAALPPNASTDPTPSTAGAELTTAVAAAAAPVVAEPPPPPDTYLSRELRHIERERSGELSVVYVLNDNSPENMKHLTGLKNVFAKCLPNMPKPYIVRLLFDRRHRSVVIVRNDGTVIGGITYRPFYPQRFAEIAFCAIAQSLQVSGFGTRLMNWTKHYARLHDGCEYFLTYADNNAVGYFSKQGFTKSPTMPKDRWHGYIKDYDGGTLMECYIHPSLPFIHLPEMMTAHRAAVDRAVQRYSHGHVVRPGLNWWKEGRGPMPVTDIPGVREAGWSETAIAAAGPKYKIVVAGKLVDPTLEHLHLLMESLIAQMDKEEALVWPFREPVDPAVVPDYHTHIKDPIDLSEIRRKVGSRGFYLTLDIFTADVERMFDNAMVYNTPETLYYKNAAKLKGMFQSWLNTAVIYD